MKNFIKTALVAAAVTATMGFSAASAAVIYTYSDGETDFGGKYRGIGSYDDAIVTSAGKARVSFDLFGARSIDGDNAYKDVFTIILNGATIFSGSFNMSGGGANVVDTNVFGWAWNTVTNGGGGFFEGGVTSVSGLVDLIDGNNEFAVIFSSPGAANNNDQGLDDESWALNNLTVATVPLPAGLPLLLAGLAGLGALRSRKRKA